jgi:hypothetical protein
MVLLKAGSRPKVWEQFNHGIPQRTRLAKYGGSDQAWYAMCLGHNEAVWDQADGVYSFRNDIAPKGGELPSGARIVIFHGGKDPWDEHCQKIGWIRKHYQ